MLLQAMQHGDGIKSYIIFLINTFAFQFQFQIQRQLSIFVLTPLAVSFLLMFYARNNKQTGFLNSSPAGISVRKQPI